MTHAVAHDQPALLRMRPHIVLSNTLVALAVVWASVIVFDVLVVPVARELPLWTHLFNNAPVEWAQWFLLALAVVTAAHLSSSLRADGAIQPSRFFLLFAIGTSFMLIEEAGDIRHNLRRLAGAASGYAEDSWRVNMMVEAPYFSLLAAIPLYALFRYGPSIWSSRRTRRYLIGGYGLYGAAAGGSTLRMVGANYATIGAWIDDRLFGGRWPIPENRPPEAGYFMMVDGPIEESVELVAAACFLAIVLAYAHDRQQGQREDATAAFPEDSV